MAQTTTTPAKATPAKASAQKTLQPAQKPAAATTPTTAAVTPAPAPAPTPTAKKGDIKQAKKAAAQQKQPAATQPAPAAATKSQPTPKADPPANSGNNNNGNNNNGNGNGAPTVIVRQPPPKSGFKMPFWLPWAIAFGAFVCILFLAVFVFQDAAMKCVGCIETTCYWTFRTILMPFKFLWWLTRTICYPIKQCFLSVKDRCSRHYYPAEQKVSGLDY